MSLVRAACVALLIFGRASSPAGAHEEKGAPHRLVDQSLTSWSEDAGPFPFGVYAIAQDRDGYLWLGTRNGLVRFDGSTFTIWKGSSQLLGDRISTIFTARDGSMWIGYGAVSGVTRVLGSEARNFDVGDGLSPGLVNDLLEDDRGVIWASTYGGLSKFENGRWTVVNAGEGLPTEANRGVFYDSHGTYWVSTGAGVYRKTASSKRFELFAPVTGRSFAEDRRGTIWMTDPRNGFAALDGPWRSHEPSLNWQGAMGWTMLRDRDGNLWIGTRGHGVVRVSGLDAAGEPVIERMTRGEGLPTNEIRSLFQDRDGTIWIGTRLGLTRLSERNIQVAIGGRRQDAFVEAVTASRDGSIWTGTAEGLHRQRGEHTQSYGVDQGLPGQIVTSLHEDRAGTLWVATTQGIARFDGNRFTAIPRSAGPVLQDVQSMMSDRNGALWLCDVRGLFKWADGQLTRMDPAALEGRPYVGYGDSGGRVWVGYWIGGLAMYQGEKISTYSVADGLPGGVVNVIYEDSHGWMWVGTSKGLARSDGERFVTFSNNGFPQAAVVSIAEDDGGNLWFGLATGLIRVPRDEFERVPGTDQATLRYQVYGSEDGLPGTLGRPGMPSSARDITGHLWFVTSVGLVVIDPNHLNATPARGPLRIEDVIADGREYEPADRLKLPPRTSRVQIGFSILSLAASGKPRFRYRLDRFDSDWQDVGERRQAFYTNLPPGPYTLRVVASNPDGSWSQQESTLAFSIQPAFYQTISFYVLMFALVGLAMWLAWRLRLRRIERQFDLVLAERSRMGREIHDTLLQSLVGVALEFDDISEQLGPSSESLSRQVRRIRQQVEHYIREARQSIWNLRSPLLQTSDLPTALKHCAHAAIAGNRARFEFTVEGTARRAAARVEEQLLRIGQEAVSNAARHSGADTIKASICYSASKVSLTVRDDGCGFDLNQVDTAADGHWGVISMRERAQQIGATLHLTSAAGSGTAVEVTAPLAWK